MRKFFIIAAIALAVCAPRALAANAQASNIRVGPLSEEKVASEGKAAPAPKSEKKADADTKAPKKEPADGQIPAVAASTTLPAAVEPNKSSSASDAPPKTNSPVVPVSTLEKSGGMEAGGDGVTSKNAGADPPAPAPTTTNAVTTTAPLTSIYRIGVGDVLDIRLLNLSEARQSTLFTVLAGGVVEYPLLTNPMNVAGLTTDELALQLISALRKRGVYDKPQVRVSVRDYASHAVLVSGLAGDPGTKILRREAIPLYVVVAEAQPKPEAGRAIVISHSTGKTTSADLNDAAAMNMLVQQGDVINLVVRPREFFYVGGEINAPGQKDFHTGMTLTQAVLASGGVTRIAAGRVKVSRQGDDGRLVSVEYNLKEIEDGHVPDPSINAGDRIEVARGKK